MQTGRKGRLNPAVGFARAEFARVINDFLGRPLLQSSGRRRSAEDSGHVEGGETEKPLFLVACSGGPDSLALAAVAAHFARRQDARVGAVIVDHQLQEGSAEVAQKAADQCRKLGLDPVTVKTVTVDDAKHGPEMAARLARYGAFADAVAETRAHGVLLAHTLDDQAETVLLGLARGSGTKSLAGMPTVRKHEGFPLIRPLLSVRRNQVAEICAAEELIPWHDPTNADETLLRARVRHTILPFLERELGGDVATALSQTATIAGADSDYLHSKVQAAFNSVVLDINNLKTTTPELAHQRVEKKLQVSAEMSSRAELALAIDRGALADMHPALRIRVLAHAVLRAGGQSAGYERLKALDAFAATPHRGGPLQMAGHIAVYKTRPPVLNESGKSLRKSGVLVFLGTQQTLD